MPRPRSTIPPFSAESLLEPLKLLPAGTVLTPEEGQPILIHVDAVRHQRNRHFRITPPEPLVRIIRSDGEIYHARGITGSAFTLVEDYASPLPRRTQAICILKTYEPITIVE